MDFILKYLLKEAIIIPTFNSIKGVEKYIERALNDALEHEVFTTVRDLEMEHIQVDVFDIYPNPVIYERRSNGGIDDLDNIVKSRPVKNGILEVENRTEFNPGYYTENSGEGLVGLIEHGDGWNGYYYDYSAKPYASPRPFIANTRNELVKNKAHMTALKLGLKRNGINAK